MNFKEAKDKDTIYQHIDEWTKNTFGPVFKFRDRQKEVIADIIYAWLNNIDDNILLNAPTGSGKSIIAITVAGVLSRYYDATGYILISDLSLLQQYEDTIDKYLPHWAVIRGQQSYTCIVNGFNYTLGACKIMGINPTRIDDSKKESSKFNECIPYCEYVLARDKAERANVTVCTYSFWIIQQNMIRNSNNMSCSAFSKRDFTICDEAHKLLDIVQSHFSPRISKEDLVKFNLIFESSKNLYFSNSAKLSKEIESLYRDMLAETDKDKLAELIKRYSAILNNISEKTKHILQDMTAHTISTSNTGSRREDKQKVKVNYKLMNACMWLTDCSQKFNDYCNIIDKIDKKYIVKNDDPAAGKIIFNCLDESYLMNSRFHKKCGKRLYMSATIPDEDTFKKDISVDSLKYIKMPAVFDYQKSPIFFVNEYRMSYKEKDTSFPHIAEMVADIFELYPAYKGIIQTGSYSFAQKLYDMLPDKYRQRIILYNDSAAKQDSILAYKYSDNKVLVGPTLVEGISLDDDLCRFQIIMKVPYPSLADKFIAAKKDFNQQWYSNLAAISILQGVGRGVRNENDWCVTFILDACFQMLFNMSRKVFPPEFVARMAQIPSTALKAYRKQ